jgi:hypothetical protein
MIIRITAGKISSAARAAITGNEGSITTFKTDIKFFLVQIDTLNQGLEDGSVAWYQLQDKTTLHLTFNLDITECKIDIA